MCLRDSPPSFGPSPIGIRTFVDSSTSSRLPSIALPTISSDTPAEYIFAVSRKFTPASRHISICRVADPTSVLPTPAKPPTPPKVIVPIVNVETRKPERPSWRYSIV